MTQGIYLTALAFITLVAVMAFAFRNRWRTHRINRNSPREIPIPQVYRPQGSRR